MRRQRGATDHPSLASIAILMVATTRGPRSLVRTLMTIPPAVIYRFLPWRRTRKHRKRQSKNKCHHSHLSPIWSTLSELLAPEHHINLAAPCPAQHLPEHVPDDSPNFELLMKTRTRNLQVPLSARQRKASSVIWLQWHPVGVRS
jgi:hypothetical protein